MQPEAPGPRTKFKHDSQPIEPIPSASSNQATIAPTEHPHTMKTQTRIVILGALLTLAAPFATALRAQSEDTPPPPARQGPGGGERGERGNPAERLARLKEALGLTDAQVEQLKKIFAAEREEIAAKRKELGQDADRAAIREAMQAIREKYKAQIDAVLTEEQRAKFAEMNKRGPRPGGPDGEGKPRKEKGDQAPE